MIFGSVSSTDCLPAAVARACPARPVSLGQGGAAEGDLIPDVPAQRVGGVLAVGLLERRLASKLVSPNSMGSPVNRLRVLGIVA